VRLERQASPWLWRLAQVSAGRQAEALALDCRVRQLVLVALDLLAVEDLLDSLHQVSRLLDLLLRASVALLVAHPVSLLPLVAVASLRGDESMFSGSARVPGWRYWVRMTPETSSQSASPGREYNHHRKSATWTKV
jgi:hypothetical protein